MIDVEPHVLELFAAHAQRAADEVGPGGRFGDLVYLSSAHARYRATGGLLSLGRFKQWLVEAHRAGLVELHRADIPRAFDRELLDESLVRLQTPDGRVVAQFDLIESPRRRRSNPVRSKLRFRKVKPVKRGRSRQRRPNPSRRPIHVADPYDAVPAVLNDQSALMYGFGTNFDTKVIVWGESDAMEGLEIAALWLAENAAGAFDEPDYKAAAEELGLSWPARKEDEEAIREAAEEDMTYTESGWLVSWMWSVNDVYPDDELYREAFARSMDEVELTDQEWEDADRAARKLGFASVDDAIDSVVRENPSGGRRRTSRRVPRRRKRNSYDVTPAFERIEKKLARKYDKGTYTRAEALREFSKLDARNADKMLADFEQALDRFGTEPFLEFKSARYKTATKKPAAKKPARHKTRRNPGEASAAFSVHVSDEGVLQDNARERLGPDYGIAALRIEAMNAGFVDAEGTITNQGWEQLNKDVKVIENNAMTWLRRVFDRVGEHGHDRYGDLVGTVWFDPKSPVQAWNIVMGNSERIDFDDYSYGDFAGDTWEGVSSFGQSVLSGHITFFDVDLNVLEVAQDTVESRENPIGIRPPVRKPAAKKPAAKKPAAKRPAAKRPAAKKPAAKKPAAKKSAAKKSAAKKSAKKTRTRRNNPAGKYVVVGDLAYEVDTKAQIRRAERALKKAGMQQAPVWYGDPNDPDSRKSGTEKLFA